MFLPASFRSLSTCRKAAQGPSEPHPPPVPSDLPPLPPWLSSFGKRESSGDPFNPSPPPWQPNARSQGACEFPRRTLPPPLLQQLCFCPPFSANCPSSQHPPEHHRGGGPQPCRGGGCRLWCRAALAHHAGIPMSEMDVFCPLHGQGGYQHSAPPPLPSWLVPRELWHRSHACQGASPWWAAWAVWEHPREVSGTFWGTQRHWGHVTSPPTH